MMKKRVVLIMYLATLIASLVNLGLFYVVTALLAEPYLNQVGALVHETVDANKALLHLVTQGSILGGLGGSLYVFQLITNYVSSGDTNLFTLHGSENYFLYALIVPLKGLVAGIIGATVVGGLIMLLPIENGLRNGHLFIIGCACIAGYSEQFLQRIIDTASRKVDSLEPKS